MKKCVINDENAATALSSDVKFCSSLKSLTITEFSLLAQQVESLFSLTPALVRLKLTNLKYRKLDYAFDGSYWEDFIRMNLSSLKKFEIYFRTSSEEINDFARLITSFRNPFWVEEKRWLVACAFVMGRVDNIWLYTLPISVNIVRDPVRCELSSRDSVCHWTNRCLNEVFDATATEVSTHVFH